MASTQLVSFSFSVQIKSLGPNNSVTELVARLSRSGVRVAGLFGFAASG